jgi:hypothetical protein
VTLSRRWWLALVGAVALASAEATEPTVEPPQDPKEEYVVGIAQFASSFVGPQHAYLATSIPSLLQERVGAVDVHRFTDLELEGSRDELLRQAVTKAGQAVADAYEARDALLFSSSDEYEEHTRKIEEARARLEALEAMSPAAVSVEAKKPVRLSEPGGTGRLYAPVHRRPDLVADELELDLLVWGMLEQIEEYLYVECHAYSAAAGETLLSSGDAVSLDDVDRAVEALAAELATVILGRVWGTVRVTADPADAAIRVNGDLVGMGFARVPYLAPGSHEVRVSRTDYDAEEETVHVAAGTVRDLSVVLRPRTRKSVRIWSEPAGAAVYLQSEWVGTTPLSVQIAARPVQGSLRLDGYRDTEFLLDQDSPDTRRYILTPAVGDRTAAFERSKDSFYAALGWFVLSVPVPLAASGLRDTMVTAYEQSISADRFRYATLANVFHGSYLGGLALSGGLLVNAAVKLARYISAGDRSVR